MIQRGDIIEWKGINGFIRGRVTESEDGQLRVLMANGRSFPFNVLSSSLTLIKTEDVKLIPFDLDFAKTCITPCPMGMMNGLKPMTVGSRGCVRCLFYRGETAGHKIICGCPHTVTEQ